MEPEPLAPVADRVGEALDAFRENGDTTPAGVELVLAAIRPELTDTPAGLHADLNAARQERDDLALVLEEVLAGRFIGAMTADGERIAQRTLEAIPTVTASSALLRLRGAAHDALYGPGAE